jgi:hypothetical protein
MGKRVLVCGDRAYPDAAYLWRRLDEYLPEPPEVVIDGAAAGADTMAHEWADAHGYATLRFPAEWAKYGRAAGPVRNRQMIVEGHPDLVIAFHRDLVNSKGTKDMVRQARGHGIDVIVDGGA